MLSIKNPIIKRFLIRAAIVYLVWTVLYYGFILPDGRLNDSLTTLVVKGTVIGLNLLNHDTSGVNNIIQVNNNPVVLVEDGCNGLELFALYVGFLLAFPGSVKYKLLFVPLGLLIIFLVNVIREIVLALNYMFFRESFEFNHKYTYVFIVYIIVFVIWRYWLRNYSLISNESK